MLLFIRARPPLFLLGPVHACPCATRTSPLPPRSHCHRGPPTSMPARRCPNNDAPCGTPTARPALSSPFSLSAAPPTELAPKTQSTRQASTPSSPTPLRPPSRAPPPSPPFPRPYRRLRPPEASPSRRILPSAATVFPLSGECPPSFAIPRIGAKSLFPLPHRCYRTPPRTSTTTGATPPPLNTAAPAAFRRPTPFVPPHR
jgi:hypothetical protein